MEITARQGRRATGRAATQALLWLHVQNDDRAAKEDLLERIYEEAKRFGVGVIIGSDPANYETWETEIDPERFEPDPEALNEFIAAQLPDGTKQEMLAWFR